MSRRSRQRLNNDWTDATPSPAALQLLKMRAALGAKLRALRALIVATPGGISGVMVALAAETARYFDTTTGRVIGACACLSAAGLLL